MAENKKPEKEICTYINNGKRNIPTSMDVDRLEEMGFNIWTIETKRKILNFAMRNMSGQNDFVQHFPNNTLSPE